MSRFVRPADPIATARALRVFVETAMKEDANAVRIGQLFSTLYEYMETRPIEGGCYFLSAMGYVLLRESGVDAALCIGCIQRPEIHNLIYPHSWVEIDRRPFDIAIARPNPHRRFSAASPVVNGLDVDTGEATVARYGGFSEESLGSEAHQILNGTVGSYVSRIPKESDYGWKEIETLGRKAGIEVSALSLKAAHTSARWTLREVAGSER